MILKVGDAYLNAPNRGMSSTPGCVRGNSLRKAFGLITHRSTRLADRRLISKIHLLRRSNDRELTRNEIIHSYKLFISCVRWFDGYICTSIRFVSDVIITCFHKAGMLHKHVPYSQSLLLGPFLTGPDHVTSEKYLLLVFRPTTGDLGS